MKKPKCYIAGGMRDYDNYNFPAFDKAKAEVEALGFIPISPADMDRLYEGWGEAPPEYWEFNFADARRMIARDLQVIATECDAIYMLEGWSKSAGSLVEIALAQFLHLAILGAGE